MPLYFLTLFFADGRQVQLAYKNHMTALAQQFKLPSSLEATTVTDDFGAHFSAAPGVVVAAHVVDMAESLNCEQELQLLKARAQHQLESKVKADPVLNSRVVMPHLRAQ